MKKTLTVVLITLICLVAFASCEKNCEHITGEWEHNETGHWQPIICSLNTCDLEETPIYDHIDEDTDGVCDVCGYKPDDNLNDNSDNNSNNNANNDTNNNNGDANNNTDDNSNDNSNTTENDGDGTTENGGNGTTDVFDDGMVRTVLNGGGQGAPSLPYYVSTEIVKRCLIADGTVNANIYLGHDRWFDDLVYFTELESPLTKDELKNCTFSIVAYYNNGKNYVEVANGIDYSSNMYDVTIKDLWDGDDYKGYVVNYSQFEEIELDISSMLGVSYGYIIIELRITLPDGSQAGVMSDSVYYSVTDTEIVFGLVSNPIAHEGDPGIITHGWTYEKK